MDGSHALTLSELSFWLRGIQGGPGNPSASRLAMRSAVTRHRHGDTDRFLYALRRMWLIWALINAEISGSSLSDVLCLSVPSSDECEWRVAPSVRRLSSVEPEGGAN
jgi:hypothetical protein